MDQYIEMILDKTGGLFRVAIGMMYCFSPVKNPPDFSKLINLLSIYFQVRDDFINLANNKYFSMKTFCEDITEGKFSFPIIHSISVSSAKHDDEKDSKLLRILKQRTTNRDLKMAAVHIMRKETGSFEYTRSYLAEVRDKVNYELKQLGGHPLFSKLLASLEREVEECDV